MFNLLSGFLSPDKGDISMLDADGNWVTCKTPDELRTRGWAARSRPPNLSLA